MYILFILGIFLGPKCVKNIYTKKKKKPNDNLKVKECSNCSVRRVPWGLYEGRGRTLIRQWGGRVFQQCLWRLVWAENLRRPIDLINIHKYISNWIKWILPFSNWGNFNTVIFKCGWCRLSRIRINWRVSRDKDLLPIVISEILFFKKYILTKHQR